MYNRDLIGKTLEEARVLIEGEGKNFSVHCDDYNRDWDAELVVRADFDGAYRLMTSRFKLRPECGNEALDD